MTNKEIRIGMVVCHKFLPGKVGVVAETIRTCGYSRSGCWEIRHVVEYRDGTKHAEHVRNLKKVQP